MMRTGCLRRGSKPRPLHLQSPLQPYRASAEHVTYSADTLSSPFSHGAQVKTLGGSYLACVYDLNSKHIRPCTVAPYMSGTCTLYRQQRE